MNSAFANAVGALDLRRFVYAACILCVIAAGIGGMVASCVPRTSANVAASAPVLQYFDFGADPHYARGYELGRMTTGLVAFALAAEIHAVDSGTGVYENLSPQERAAVIKQLCDGCSDALEAQDR